MALRLTSEMLACAYDLLRTAEPFDGWNLPESDDIVFYVVRDRTRCGFYRRDRYGRHSIAISINCVGYMPTLVAIMAHEMVHLHLALTRMEGRSDHGAVFQHFAARVCAVHGFDPKLF
jgi:hypothetical protein